MQIIYNNINTSLHCSSKSGIIRPLLTVCIPKYISFNGIFKSRAGRNKHYWVLVVRSTSHITVTWRLKAKIPSELLGIWEMSSFWSACTAHDVQSKFLLINAPLVHNEILVLYFSGASYCQKDIPNTSHCWREMPFALTAHQQKPAAPHLTAEPAADIHSFSRSKTTPAALGCFQIASHLRQSPDGAG